MFKREKDKIAELERRIVILERKLNEDDIDPEKCEKCGAELIDATEMGAEQREMYCPNCDSFKTIPWKAIELR